MNSKPRILFVAEAVTLAHVARPLTLAAGLDASRWEIHLACDPRFLHLFPSLPGPVHPIHSIPGDRFLAALEHGKPLYDTATLAAYVEEEIGLLEELRPDAVIGDFRLSLAVSARRSSIPYLTISNAYWSPYAIQRYPIPELPLVHLLGLRTAQWLFDLVRPAAFAYHCLPLNRICRRFGVSAPGYRLGRVYTDADHVLYADPPNWVATRPLPPNHYFVGPVTWSPDLPLPAWWNELPDERPLVYVNLGSSGPVQLLPDILEALADLPVTVVAATAGRIEVASPPANCRVADYLPGERAIRRANLVICNGGAPTTQQALIEGVPVLGIATNLDQHLNMQAVVAHGMGRLLRSDLATPTAIASEATSMLSDPGYKKAATRMAGQYHPQQAANILDRILKSLLESGA